MSPRTLPAAELFCHADADTGEGPVVDAGRGELLWVDIPAGTLHRTRLADAADRTVRFATELGAVALRADGTLVAATAEGFALLDETTGRHRVTHPVLPDPAVRMNDAKCDRQGRFFAGSTATDFRPGAGILHVLDPARGARVVRTGLTLPNGIGWSPDDTTFYFVDSMEHVLYAAPYDLADGAVGELAPLARTAGAGALPGAAPGSVPDGLAVDADGCIWVALWGGAAIWRIGPDGRHLATLPVPATNPSSCAFGAGTTLYLTSARSGLSPAELAAAPLSGSVFAADVGVPGTPVGGFGG